MAEESAVRFLLGGTIVSLFALVGAVLEPPTFAGIFGSAPSVAIGTLALAFLKDGPAYARTETRSMLLGAMGLVAYSLCCIWVLHRPRLSVWAGTAVSWVTWFVVTLALFGVFGGDS